MYWDKRTDSSDSDNAPEGHCTLGVRTPSSLWYLAEGCTDGDFSVWILIQNPNDTAVNAEITYMRSDGNVVQQNLNVDANSRRTVDVNDALNF